MAYVKCDNNLRSWEISSSGTCLDNQLK